MASKAPFITRSPEQVARNVADTMEGVRDSLFSKGEYLADPGILDRVVWKPVGTGHQLVIKPTCTTDPSPNSPDADDATDTDDPSADASDVSPSHDDREVFSECTDFDATEMTEIPSTPAMLTMVVQLVPGANWLYPDAKWTKGNKYVPHFQDSKLLCTGGVPLHPCFTEDYNTSIDNLNTLMGQLGDGRNKRNTMTTKQPGARVKIRHALFTVCARLGAVLKSQSDLSD